MSDKRKHIACDDGQDLLVEVLFGDADDALRQRLDQHMAECAACRSEFESLSGTIALARSRPAPEPTAAMLEGLESRVLAQTVGVRPVVQRPRLQRVAVWGLRMAAVFVLIAVGVMIGRNLPQDVAGPVAPSMASVIPVESRAHAYLDRSKTLLLGVVNFDGSLEDPSSLDLPQRSRIARELLDEAAYLKTGLSESDQQRLRALVGELELILLQLANLEARSDVAEIEVVQAGVDRNAILFKIDVEKMRKTTTEKTPPGAAV